MFVRQASPSFTRAMLSSSEVLVITSTVLSMSEVLLMRPALVPSYQIRSRLWWAEAILYTRKVRRPKCHHLLLEYWLLVKLVLSCLVLLQLELVTFRKQT